MARWSVPFISALSALLVVVLVAPQSDPAEGAIPNKSGVFSARLTKSTGAIKVVNYPKRQCSSGQRLIRWNAKGQQGPQGAQGVQGAQGPQGARGPAGPADWNAIPNIPAGFKDGVDDGGFESAIKVSLPLDSWVPGGTLSFSLSLDRNIDVDCYAIPISGSASWVVDEHRTAVQLGTVVTHTFHLTTPNGGPSALSVRCRSYSEGIAPAALKKRLKDAKVTVKLKGRKKRH